MELHAAIAFGLPILIVFVMWAYAYFLRKRLGKRQRGLPEKSGRG